MSSRRLSRTVAALRRFRSWLSAERYFYGKLLGSSLAGIFAIILLATIFLTATHEKTPRESLRGTVFESLRATGRLESDLNAMENAHRDFLVTGEPSLFEQFEAARASLLGRLAALQNTVRDYPDGSAALVPFAQNFQRWSTEFAEPQMRSRQSESETTALATYAEGKSWLSATRSGLQNFRRVAAQSLEQANKRASLQRNGFGVLCALAIGFLVGSSWYTFTAFQRHLENLKGVQAQTRAIIESTLDGVITIDDAGAIQSVNPAAEKMFARSAAQLAGENIASLIPERLLSQDLAKLVGATVMAAGRREEESSFPIEVSVSELRAESGPSLVLIVRDLSVRNRGEETLKHIGLGVSTATGIEFLKSLVQELSRALNTEYAFIIELHRKGERMTSTLTLAEKGQMHTCGPFELAGSACGDVLRGGFSAYLGGARARFPEDGLLMGLEVETFVAMPLVDHLGQAVGVMGVLDRRVLEAVKIIESTLQIFAARAGAEIERKRFEEDLAAEKERLAVTLRSIGDGFITTDNEGQVLLLNNVAEKLTGWTQGQAAGKSLLSVFRLRHERTRRPLESSMMELIEEGSAAGLNGATLIISREGSERLIETNAAPIRDQFHQKVGVVLVFRDVTERSRAEEERRKNEKLESLGIAAGGIAHDFNNLLTAILGNISMVLLKADPAASSTERLAAAKKASLRAQELAQQLLTFAKGGSPIKQTASISQLVLDTVNFSLRGSNVRCEFAISADLWPADVDSGQISQVIQNLTINADQAMPTGGTLRVECGNLELAADSLRPRLKAGRYLQITVRDQGVGITEENLKKIFDPYFTTKAKGSGLGLATTYSIVKNHDGVIEVASEPGAGTTFYVFLPASDKPAVVSQAPNVELPLAVNNGGRVLVLDDEEAICALVTCALEELGYEVAEAYDSLTAIQLYENALKAGRRFDLVISDLTIPGSMGGVEALKRLRELDPTVRAIVSSGYAMDPIMADFRKFGFCGMIAKPYEIDALGRAVATALAAPACSEEKVIQVDFAEQGAVA